MIFTCFIGYYGLPVIYTACLTACLDSVATRAAPPRASACAFIQSQNIPCFGQRQLPASVARSHAVLALARGYSLTDRIAPGDTARFRVGVLTGH